MKKLILMAMIAFSGKAAMAQVNMGETWALSKVGGTSVKLDSISSAYNSCGCYVLDTMFSLKNTGTVAKPVYVASYGAWTNKTTASVAGWTILKNAITLKTNSCYYLPGVVHLDSGIIMNVPAGTKFYGSKLTPSAFVVLPKAQIKVNGIASNPVIMTSAVKPADRNRGDWGGLVIAGRAPIAGSADGTFGQNSGTLTFMEGLKDLPSRTKKGGRIYLVGKCNNTVTNAIADQDNSGSISYLQVNYGGFNVGAAGSGNELNGITLYGVGNKTIMKNIQVTEANDDGIEFFGGSVNVSNVLIINSLDDDLDIDCGYQGVIQNVVVMRLDSNARDVSISKLVEASQKNKDHVRRTTGIISNMTAFGPRSFYGKSFTFPTKFQYYDNGYRKGLGKKKNGLDSFMLNWNGTADSVRPGVNGWRDTTITGANAVDFFRGVELNTNTNISVYNSIIHGYDQAFNFVDKETANNIDSGLVIAYNTINNCNEVISLLNKKAAVNDAAAFSSSNAFPRNSVTNWLKYDQKFNNILSSDAIKAQGYDITFARNTIPSLTSFIFYGLFGKEYPSTNKALQTLGTSWGNINVAGSTVVKTSGFDNRLDSMLALKLATRIDNRGVKAFFTVGGFSINPTDDYCFSSLVRPLDTDNGTSLNNVKPVFYVENPTSFGIINIGFDNVNADKMNVNVYDLSGKKVASKKMNLDNTSGNVEMDATNLTNGVYIVETNCGGVTSSSKVVLNK